MAANLAALIASSPSSYMVSADPGMEANRHRRRIAEAMMMHGMETSPVQHWTQGMARVANAMMGGYEASKADAADVAREKSATDALSNLPGLGQPPMSLAPPMPNGKPQTTLVGDNPDYGKAIAGIESGGKYDALGPVTKSGDRAHGKYQVMGANVGPWTKQYLGQEMTPEQFAQNPQAQEAVFKGEFGRLAQKYGPEGAARAWFAGEGGMNDPNRKDVLGTTVAGYADKFNRATGAQVASLDPSAGVNAAGQPTAPVQQPAQSPAAQINPQMAGYIRALMMNPQWRQYAMQIYLSELQRANQPQYGFQTLPDGTIVRTDQRKGSVEEIYKSPSKPTWGVVDEDEYGNKKYGWIDTFKKTAEPYSPGKAQVAGAMPAPTPTASPAAPATPAPGKATIPPAPPGANPKVWRDEQTRIAADAAGGKLTEVQANSTTFANRMEDAEKNFGKWEPNVRDTWTGVKDRAVDWVSSGAYNPIPKGLTNPGLSEDYQGALQSKSQFITAMLRRESGAAIAPSEFDRYDQEFFPQQGDGPEIVKQKARARQIAIEAMKKGAGPGYTPPSTTKHAPAGVDAKLWAAMTPQEQALWQN